MTLLHRHLFAGMWLSWALYWWALSRHVKPSVRTESTSSRLSHIVPLMLAVALLWLPRVPVPILGERFVPPAAWPFWVGAALTLAGMLFSVWARVHLGSNWSGIVTVKRDHELVTSGPYAIVRHPIYTGLVLAFVGSAITLGEMRGVLAVVIVVASLWRKLRLEERWMAEQFGDDYERYRDRVR